MPIYNIIILSILGVTIIASTILAVMIANKIPIMKIQLEDAKSRKEHLREMLNVSREQVHLKI